jgi:hypothetical protein
MNTIKYKVLVYTLRLLVLLNTFFYKKANKLRDYIDNFVNNL